MNPLGVWVECDSFHFLLVVFLINIYHTLGFTTNRSFYSKLFKCKMTYLFQILIRRLFYVRLVIKVKFEFWLLCVLKFVLWHPDVSSFWCCKYDLIWCSKKKLCKYPDASYFLAIQNNELVWYAMCPIFHFCSWKVYHKNYALFSFRINWS